MQNKTLFQKDKQKSQDLKFLNSESEKPVDGKELGASTWLVSGLCTDNKVKGKAELHQNEGHSVSQVALKLLREKRLQTACLARA